MQRSRWLLIPFSLLMPLVGKAQGANPCAVPVQLFQSDVGVSANKVACTLPQLYGVRGLEFPAGSGIGPIDQGPNIGSRFAGAQAQQEEISSSLNSNVAGQLALLPFVAPASGITFTFDRSLGVYSESQDSFGPIFSERASTIGRYRLALGFSYQYMDFDHLDGISLRSFPTTFTQTPLAPPDANCPANSGIAGVVCLQSHDYVTAMDRIDLKIQQVTGFVTFGLTRLVDVSVAVPYLFVNMSATANATIQENSGYFGSTQFAGCGGVRGDCGLQNTFSNAHKASGIGDLTVRLKGTIHRWERSGLAAGIDVRVPTGNAIDLLGAGSVSVKPFFVWSYSGRLSPHVNVGYEWNGSSILGADVTTGAKGGLPSELLYSVGMEAAVTRRLTATLDLLGQRVFNGPFDSLIQVQAPSPCSGAITSGDQCLSNGALASTVGTSTRSYGINSGDIGIRVRAVGKLILTASVQLPLDSGGLRSRAVPLVSAIYTIR